MNQSRTAIWRIREPRGSSLVELMLVCAVITILVTRGYLALTGYPQIGGATLHIAHMLWGGLLMLVSALTFFQAADRIWKPTIAIVFGAGFGLFIDEIGKFVTQDNDYFFKPAVAIMYVIFIIILISTRYVARMDKRPPDEHLYFATETLARSWVGSISNSERTAALKSIDQSGISSPSVDRLRSSLLAINTSHEDDGRIWKIWDNFWNRCQSILTSKRSEQIIFAVIILHALSYAAFVIFVHNQSLPETFTEWMNAGWQTIVGLLLVAGTIVWIRKKHDLALKLFYYAMLIMLLIGQIFIFANDQFHGLIELTANVCILAGLRGIIESKNKSNPNLEQTI